MNNSKLNISLPDGSIRSFEGPISGEELALDIGPGLAKAALALRINGEIKDLKTVLDTDTTVEIVTIREEGDDVLELLRHDAAHVLAEAAKELYPETQVTIGPAIENGFYYDFARDEPFTPADLEKIEKRMHEIVDRDEQIVREEWERDAAVDFSRELARTTRLKSLLAFRRTSLLAFIAKVTFRTCVAVRICRPPKNSAMLLN